MNATSTKVSLTDREKDILSLLLEGESSKVIAKHLRISVYTVISHKRNLILKFRARNTVHMAAQAFRLGIV